MQRLLQAVLSPLYMRYRVCNLVAKIQYFAATFRAKHEKMNRGQYLCIYHNNTKGDPYLKADLIFSIKYSAVPGGGGPSSEWKSDNYDDKKSAYDCSLSVAT
jgi:hypothetical protein